MASIPHSGRMRHGEPSHDRPATGRTEALRAPLSVILGHTQHLTRSFLAGQPVPPDDYLSALAAIERAVWALEGHLRVLENERRPAVTTDD